MKKFAIWIFLSIFAEKYCDMAKYINPFTDVGFKRIFGQELSKPLLLDFLNSLFEGEKHIANLTFLDKEQPALFEEDRSLIYDIYCETDDGEKIIVEMQNRRTKQEQSGACSNYALQGGGSRRATSRSHFSRTGAYIMSRSR